MYCQRCGAPNADNVWQCTACGNNLYPPLAPAAPQTSSYAIAGLIFSIVGFFVCILIGQIIGVILGYKARREIAESGGRLGGKGLADAAIIVGWIGIALYGLLILFYAALILLFVVYESSSSYSAY